MTAYNFCAMSPASLPRACSTVCRCPLLMAGIQVGCIDLWHIFKKIQVVLLHRPILTPLRRKANGANWFIVKSHWYWATFPLYHKWGGTLTMVSNIYMNNMTYAKPLPSQIRKTLALICEYSLRVCYSFVTYNRLIRSATDSWVVPKHKKGH